MWKIWIERKILEAWKIDTIEKNVKEIKENMRIDEKQWKHDRNRKIKKNKNRKRKMKKKTLLRENSSFAMELNSEYASDFARTNRTSDAYVFFLYWSNVWID